MITFLNIFNLLLIFFTHKNLHRLVAAVRTFTVSKCCNTVQTILMTGAYIGFARVPGGDLAVTSDDFQNILRCHCLDKNILYTFIPV